ncbi:MAG: penicillin acylase family protein, partial [Terriglobales bacterium]
MTEPAQAAAPPPQLRGLRLGLDIALGLLLLAVALFAAAYWFVRSGQSGLDGTVRLAGLRAPVTIIRDARGIPHITAANVHDLYLA